MTLLRKSAFGKHVEGLSKRVCQFLDSKISGKLSDQFALHMIVELIPKSLRIQQI